MPISSARRRSTLGAGSASREATGTALFAFGAELVSGAAGGSTSWRGSGGFGAGSEIHRTDAARGAAGAERWRAATTVPATTEPPSAPAATHLSVIATAPATVLAPAVVAKPVAVSATSV